MPRIAASVEPFARMRRWPAVSGPRPAAPASRLFGSGHARRSRQCIEVKKHFDRVFDVLSRN
jgi:hypothetical protein